MNIKEIVELMHEFDASGLTKLCVQEDNLKIKFSKQKKEYTVLGAGPMGVPPMGISPMGGTPIGVQPVIQDGQQDKAAAESAAAALEKPEENRILSPLVGTYYAAASPEAAPYVKEGDRVKKGTILCLIEAMKMMNEVTAPYDCTIRKIHISDGGLVEYNTVLFDIEKAEE